MELSLKIIEDKLENYRPRFSKAWIRQLVEIRLFCSVNLALLGTHNTARLDLWNTYEEYGARDRIDLKAYKC